MMINQGKIDNPELVELFFRRSHGVPHQDRRGWAEALLFAYGWNFNDPNMPHLVKNLCQVNFADSDSLRELVSTFPTIVEADDLIVSFEAKYPGVLVDNECAARKFISLPKAGSILRRDRESKIMSRWRSNTECSHVTEEDITVLTSFYPVPGTLPEQIIDALTEQLARNIPEDSDRILHLMNSNPNFDKATLNLVIGRIKKEQEIPRSLLRRCIKIAHELGSPDMPIVRKAMTIRFVGSDMLPDSEELDICLDTLASSLHSTTDAIAAALKWTESLCKRNQIRPESVLKYLPRLLSKAAQPTFEVEKFGPLLTFWMAVIPDRRARLEFLDRLYTDFIGSTEAFDLSGETHIVVNTDRVMVLATAAVHALNIEPEYAWDYVRIFNKIGILSALVRYSELIASPEGYPRGKDSLSNHLVVLYLEERAWVGVAGLMNALPNCYHPHTVMDSVNVSLLLIRAHAPAVFIDQALNQIVHWTARKAIEIWIWSDTNSRYTYTFQKRLAASRNEKNVVVFGHPDSFESPDFQNRVTEGRSDEPSNPTEIRYATQIVSIEKSALANIAQILSLAACDGLISSTQSGNICLQLISHSIDVIQVLNSEQRSRSAGASAIDPVETASSRFIYTQKIMDMLYFLTALFAIGFNSSIPKSDGTPRGRVGELVIPASRDGRPLTFMYFAMEYAKLILEFPQAFNSHFLL
ncbi:hypothetical protein EBR96_06505 [bacterium]|nr:hypothetical protein [bacterium]